MLDIVVVFVHSQDIDLRNGTVEEPEEHGMMIEMRTTTRATYRARAAISSEESFAGRTCNHAEISTRVLLEATNTARVAWDDAMRKM